MRKKGVQGFFFTQDSAAWQKVLQSAANISLNLYHSAFSCAQQQLTRYHFFFLRAWCSAVKILVRSNYLLGKICSLEAPCAADVTQFQRTMTKHRWCVPLTRCPRGQGQHPARNLVNQSRYYCFFVSVFFLLFLMVLVTRRPRQHVSSNCPQPAKKSWIFVKANVLR